jgi:hypothetical protein
MLDEHVIFFEAAGIEEDAEALARGQPALRMLRCNTLRTPALARGFAFGFKLFDRGGHVQRLPR